MEIKKNRKGCFWRQLIILLAAVFLFITGCGGKGNKAGQKSVIIPSADGKETLGGNNLTVDISHPDMGYIMVKYEGSASKLYVQLAGPDQTQYKYFIEPSPDYVTLPLTQGSGEYFLSIYENVGRDNYSPVLSQTMQVELSSEFAPFLCPSQYVDFTMDSEAVRYARELTEGIEDDLEKVQTIYRWVVRNLTYDYDKAVNVSTGYLPDIDRTLKSKTGICFDYAALMAAMQRSLGIPTKLNIGYLTGDIYHAWVSVYLDETGWIDNLIQFNGSEWAMMDPTVASSSGNQEVKGLASDDANYITRYVR